MEFGPGLFMRDPPTWVHESSTLNPGSIPAEGIFNVEYFAFGKKTNKVNYKEHNHDSFNSFFFFNLQLVVQSYLKM